MPLQFYLDSAFRAGIGRRRGVIQGQLGILRKTQPGILPEKLLEFGLEPAPLLAALQTSLAKPLVRTSQTIIALSRPVTVRLSSGSGSARMTNMNGY